MLLPSHLQCSWLVPRPRLVFTASMLSSASIIAAADRRNLGVRALVSVQGAARQLGRPTLFPLWSGVGPVTHIKYRRRLHAAELTQRNASVLSVSPPKKTRTPGLAIYNSHILEFQFPMVTYKKLLGLPVGLEDLAELQPDIHRCGVCRDSGGLGLLQTESLQRKGYTHRLVGYCPHSR